jgi:hypothetical protein
MLLVVAALIVGSSLGVVVAVFRVGGTQEAIRTGLQLLTLAVSVLLISLILLFASGSLSS